MAKKKRRYIPKFERPKFAPLKTPKPKGPRPRLAPDLAPSFHDEVKKNLRNQWKKPAPMVNPPPIDTGKPLPQQQRDPMASWGKAAENFTPVAPEPTPTWNIPETPVTQHDNYANRMMENLQNQFEPAPVQPEPAVDLGPTIPSLDQLAVDEPLGGVTQSSGNFDFGGSFDIPEPPPKPDVINLTDPRHPDFQDPQGPDRFNTFDIPGMKDGKIP